jgi:hypothetical protein
VLAFVAILYNPIFKVSLEREVWTGVNLLTIGLLAVTCPPRMEPPLVRG